MLLLLLLLFLCIIIIIIIIQDRASQTAMETYETRECAANVDAHYLINNTNVMTATVTARKHRGINNSMNKNNSEGVHTQNVFLSERKSPKRSETLKTDGTTRNADKDGNHAA